MAKSANINSFFAQLSCLLLLGGFISAVTTGGNNFLTIFVVIYFMLVATNGIQRGESYGRKK